MGSRLLYFGLGALTDVMVVLYYRAVSSRMHFLAVLMSVLVTLVPFLVTEAGLTKGKRNVFLPYALGAGAGTLLGMLVRL
jgi:hypothetical protein